MATTSDPSSGVRTTYTETIEVRPAARVHAGPDPAGTGPQVAHFQSQGFVVLRGVLGPAALAELDAELNRLAEQHATLPRIREGYDLEPRQDPTRRTPTFRKIGGISDLSPAFRRLLAHPRILEVLHAIMGPEVQLFRDVVMMKPARVGREKPWHQDSVYWPYEPMELVSAMTALDDAGPENGCLQVVPATHREVRQHYGAELRIDPDEELQARTLYVPLRAGDTLLFHSLLLHGSEPNHSEQDRRVCIFSYKPQGLRYIGKGEEPERVVVSRRSG